MGNNSKSIVYSKTQKDSKAWLLELIFEINCRLN